ncbi:MAG: FAD-binding protein, partial [Deltaproteobacteria bacterium]|nr:FAD-binding protein [Deltaproteobacteria bacterium]
MMEMDKPVETGVLIVGGGIGGLMAAVNAADNGADVLIAEKANTKRSGSGATGNDHFTCYIPEVHGDDIEPIVNEVYASLLGRFQDGNVVTTYLRESFGIVKNWDKWGIGMKVDGKWEFTGHAFPGRPRIFLKYAGANQKEVLNREAEKRNVKIENRWS